jgi:hypothetical protein
MLIHEAEHSHNNSTGYPVFIDAIISVSPPAPAKITEYFNLYNPSLPIGLYTVKGMVNVFSSDYYDSNLTNNEASGGGFNATWLLGDINNDRIVEMMDFFIMSQHYLEHT